MATTTFVPVEVYLRSCYELDEEYVDERIEERPTGEFHHASWQPAVQLWFLQNAKKRGIRVRPRLRVQVAATRYRFPDVTVLDRNQPIEQIITRPPLAVFEGLSPEDSLQPLKRKLEDYEAMGITVIWVIDPQDSTYDRYGKLGLHRKEVFSFAEKGIAFDMNQLKELLD